MVHLLSVWVNLLANLPLAPFSHSYSGAVVASQVEYPPSSLHHLAEGWKDDGLVTAAVTPRSGSGAVNPVEKREWEDGDEVWMEWVEVRQTGK